MGISGDTIREAEFSDDSGKLIKVNLAVRDIIYFKLLERLPKAIMRSK